ncbi:MAG: Oxidoreductase, short-chain dehydrogenase/reductase family [Ktedonobacterales bacterium]|nr:MAG: Oxidoreductase, short-chain dehydrogenase/reductase family [Ktedonobacterales bacterium]
MRTSAELLSMEARRILITGAAAGIGKAMALRFAEAGADLVLMDIDEAGLARTVEDLGKTASQVTTQVVDLTDKAQIEAFWSHIEPNGPDTLINNAGAYRLRDFFETDSSYLDQTLALNLESVLWMCQAFIAKRKKVGGVIINISSVEAVVPFRDDLIPYGVSKAGIIALTRSLAHAFGRQGFRVNALLPGAIKTPGTQYLMKTAVQHLNVDLMKTGYQFGTRLSLGRWGFPDEVATAALFLASDLASYVQGAVLPVDGGFLSS